MENDTVEITIKNKIKKKKEKWRNSDYGLSCNIIKINHFGIVLLYFCI